MDFFSWEDKRTRVIGIFERFYWLECISKWQKKEKFRSPSWNHCSPCDNPETSLFFILALSLSRDARKYKGDTPRASFELIEGEYRSVRAVNIWLPLHKLNSHRQLDYITLNQYTMKLRHIINKCCKYKYWLFILSLIIADIHFN